MKTPRIHVVGSSPRSGTTLIFELLAACFDLQKVGDHETSLFSAPRRITGPYVSKKPTDLVHAARVFRWDPNLHLIYMQRDPRDIIVSEHGSHKGTYWCDFPVWRRNQSLLPRVQNSPRFFECRYEDLVRHPDKIQAQLAAHFTFMQQTHAFSTFEQVSRTSGAADLALKGVRPISDHSVGSWRRDLPRVAAQLRAHPDMAEAIVSAGYASSSAWADELTGIEPDTRTSVRAMHDVLRGKGPLATAAARMQRRIGTFRDETLYALGYRRTI